MNFKVVEVKSKKDRKEFVNLPLRMYKDIEWFVPPMYGDELKIFDKNYIFSKVCDSSFFLALDEEGKTIGRIQGIIQKQYNELRNVNQARFSRFDCIDNKEVAKALFEAVERWAKGKGADFIVGPLGFSDQEREGLLIEGFDYLNTFEEQYNFPYYQGLVENAGYVKDIDWLEFRMTGTNQNLDTLNKLCDRALKTYDLRLVDEKMPMNKIIKKYAEGIFEVLDTCYSHLYGTVPFTDETRDQMIEQFKLILDSRYFTIIVDKNDKVVAFGFCIPGIGSALKKSGGRLTLPAIIRILKTKKNPESVDMALVGILPQYRNSALSAFVVRKLVQILNMPSVKYLETNLNYEENKNIMSLWKRFDYIQHKKRRAFIKHL